MTYIDFDGVILDTDELLFEEWRKLPNRDILPEREKIKYIQKANWEHILYNSDIINDSIYYLKQMNPKTTFILTKVHSLTNEASAKIKWLREQGVQQNALIVPYDLNKNLVGIAKGNILVDDCIKNLRDWEKNGGYPILFDIDDDGYDSWGKPNINEYQKVMSLKDIRKRK